MGTQNAFKPAPAWYRGQRWEELSLGARLNLAFQAAREELPTHLPSKELWENREFYAQTLDVLCGHFATPVLDEVLDVGGGHGLISLLWLAHGTAQRATIVDHYEPHSHRLLLAKFLSVVDFEPPTYLHQRLEDVTLLRLPERSAILGVHCCGRLTDAVIDLALQMRRPFAVLPCCHGAKERDKEFLAMLKAIAHRKGISFFDAYDFLRLGRAWAAGWKVYFTSISPTVSPRNNVLIGLPPKDMAERGAEGKTVDKGTRSGRP
ncbi:MAG TPA: hypothetical protein EYP85_02610 [Armatimonadetes bacterium]|nr:hypothetical protein [Armatimonadota bacterium]